MLAISLFLFALLSQRSDGKILRNGNDFFARFKLVDTNSRIKANCIRNITSYTTPKECSMECVNEPNCQSFNRHKLEGFCELLAISKFNQSGLLQRDLNWVHFEPNDDEENVGTNCIELKPCQPYEICEDTLTSHPAYKCRCRDGFDGEKCQLYTGPGTEKTRPAASCRLLLLKYKSIPDGDYWFEGKEKPVRCERRVDGRYTPWSLFGPCKGAPCGNGTRQRNRTCTNPQPKGGGKSCDHFGLNQEVRPCEKCTDCSVITLFSEGTSFTTAKGLAFATIGKLLREFKVQFDFKIDPNYIINLYTKYINIFALMYGQKWSERGPSLFLHPTSNNTIVIHNAYEDGAGEQQHFNGMGNYAFFEDWIHVDISQKKDGAGVYVYTLLINGTEMKSSVNHHTRVINDMTLYMSSNYYFTAGALIKNFNIEDCSVITLFSEGTSFTTAKGLAFATIGKLLREFKVQFDFKIDPNYIINLYRMYINIFALMYGQKWSERGPSLFLHPSSNNTIVIHNAYEDLIKGQFL